jgi:hypothetical protein
MSFDMEKILASKRALRRELAVRPIAEKPRMLDALRERTLMLRPTPASGDVLRETPAPYRAKPA